MFCAIKVVFPSSNTNTFMGDQSNSSLQLWQQKEFTGAASVKSLFQKYSDCSNTQCINEPFQLDTFYQDPLINFFKIIHNLQQNNIHNVDIHFDAIRSWLIIQTCRHFVIITNI